MASSVRGINAAIRKECRFNEKGSFAAGQGFGHVDAAGPDAFVGAQDVKFGENAHRRIRVVWADAIQLVPSGVVDASAYVVRIRLKRGEVEPRTRRLDVPDTVCASHKTISTKVSLGY